MGRVSQDELLCRALVLNEALGPSATAAVMAPAPTSTAGKIR